MLHYNSTGFSKVHHTPIDINEFETHINCDND